VGSRKEHQELETVRVEPCGRSLCERSLLKF